MGNALHFDGTNDYVSFSSALLPTSPNAAWAVEAWIKTTTTEHDVLFSQYEVNTSLRSTIDIGNINSGKAGFWKKSAPGDGIIVQSTTSVNDGDWHHIAIVKEGAGAGQVHLYVDGVLEDSGTDAADMANTPTELGRINNTADGRYFPGELDEVRIWDIARNQTDIQAAMNQALAGNEPGLIAYYDFNQGVADSDNGSGCPGGAPCEDELTSLTGGNHGGLNGFALAGSTSNWVGSQELSTITFTNDFNNQSTLTDNFPLGATLVTWTATDAAGNSTSCTMSVTVNDNEAPAPDADPLPDIQVDCGAALTPPTATDNCAGPVTATNDDLLGAGTHIINWVYDDGNGNTSTQTQTVTITDDIPPVLTCQDITLQLDNNGQAALTPEMIAPGLSDNCGLPTTYLSHTLFDCSRLGGPGPNYALEFLEDRREYVQFISPFTGGADFTLEAWFANDNQLGLDPSYLISWMDQSLEIYDEAGALFVRLGSTVAPLAALTRDGQWRHIAIVREGPSATVYLDGEEAWNGPTDVSLTDLF
ncbi:MAG: HYR domain-containing protein, partial [Phaeodactylibacter sp.]|nr:HYR domain-containing protein [Phaeodactylibacter sp.]